MENNDNAQKQNNKEKFEKLMFKNERIKRYKKNILWKNYSYLISEEKIVYNKEDKKLISDLLYNPIPKEFRPKYWLIMSGAKQEIINNPGYYEKLKKLIKISPNFPFSKSVSLDLHRTFSSIDYFQKEENLEKLSNILLAFSLRNSISIGYCQGFNFIVGQIMLVVPDEEEVFWIFTKIVEDFLPFDFFLKFSGVRIDTTVVLSTLTRKLPYIDKNEGLKLCLNNLINRCFISLYSEIVGINLLRNIWDIFFFYGDIVLFRTFNFIAFLLCEKKYETYSIEKIHEELMDNLKFLEDTDLLNYFLLLEHSVNDSFIKENRKRKKNNVYGQNVKFKESIAGDGVMTCDLRTPYCIYNKEINDINKYNEFKIFRFNKNTKYHENYFSNIFIKENEKGINDEETERENTINNSKGINDVEDIDDIKKEKEVTLDDYNNILVERHKHVCQKKE